MPRRPPAPKELRPQCASSTGCRVKAQMGSTFCFWHDPATRERAREARRLTWVNRRGSEHRTPRQVQALRAYVGAGAGYQGAADRLQTTPRVVQSRVRRLRLKLGVATVEQLIYVGVRDGWLDVPDLRTSR